MFLLSLSVTTMGGKALHFTKKINLIYKIYIRCVMFMN